MKLSILLNSVSSPTDCLRPALKPPISFALVAVWEAVLFLSTCRSDWRIPAAESLSIAIWLSLRAPVKSELIWPLVNPAFASLLYAWRVASMLVRFWPDIPSAERLAFTIPPGARPALSTFWLTDRRPWYQDCIMLPITAGDDMARPPPRARGVNP